jgi:Ca-activated chloride channel family protein
MMYRAMNQRNILFICICGLAVILCLGLVLAQDRKAQTKEQDDYTLQVDVNLVNINVAVTTSSGNYLADLKKENFRIFEDKVEQQITNFSPVDAPFAVALVLDTSGSTEGKLARIQDEAIAFVKQLHPDDEVMVISFDDEVHLETDFTRNRNAIERAVKRTRTGQATQLYEAVYLALEEKLRKRRERKAMVLFTDGVDTASPTSSAKETIEKAKEADALIYSIFFDTRNDMRRMSRGPYPSGQSNPRFPVPGRVPVDPRSPRQRDNEDWQIEMESQRGRSYLHDLAEATGGTLFDAQGVDSLGNAFAKIAHELRSLYSLGYISSNKKKDGKFRKILVKVDQPNTVVKAKKGYYSPKK